MRRLKSIISPRASAILGLLCLLMASPAFAEKPVDGNIGFQEPATPVMHKLVKFHDGLLLPIIVAIVAFVLIMLVIILIRFNEKANPVPSKTSHNTWLEVVWTIVPVLILMVLVVPSIELLYFQDRVPETDMTIKVTGNTWNWEYGYPDYEGIEPYISNVLTKEQAEAEGKPYLLAADAPLVVPVGRKVKVLVTSNTNIHSFAVPSFGIKIDAVPGRINETWFEVEREGTFYGQCSEICGVNHAFMPIEIIAVSPSDFDRWVANGGTFDTTFAQNDLGATGTLSAANK